MEIDPALAQFIDAPTTLDLVVRRTEYLAAFLNENPQIVVSQALGGQFVILYADSSELDNIQRGLGTSFVGFIPLVMGLLDTTALESSGILQVQEQPYLDLGGRGVLVGIVDTGIDYTQQAFIYEDGTSKIQYIYDQSVRGNTPEGFFVGTEYTNAQINEALQSENPYDIVPQQDTVGHGTFLASLAAGRRVGANVGAAPEAELIVVKLKPARQFYRDLFVVPQDQEDAYESIALMLGVEYILRKARELNRPVAICIGLGTTLGSHDGFSVVEEYLSAAANLRGVCICTAAGNESQARHHTQGKLAAAGENQNIDIRVGENAGSFLVGLWSNAPDRLSVAVRSPTGEMVGRIPAKTGSVTTVRLVLERTTVTVQYHFPVEISGGQLTVISLLDATPGIWTVIVHADILLDGTYHAWLPLTGFVAPSVEFMTPTPYYTIVVPATAIGTITVGAYNHSNNSLYVGTSWGPTRLPMMSPDLVAPGVNVAGLYPSGYGTMNGTSAAAAITTGACALLLQWGIVEGNDVAISTYQIRAYLIRGCSRSDTVAYPNTQWGYGRLNLLQSFNLMREV